MLCEICSRRTDRHLAAVKALAMSSRYGMSAASLISSAREPDRPAQFVSQGSGTNRQPRQIPSESTWEKAHAAFAWNNNEHAQTSKGRDEEAQQ